MPVTSTTSRRGGASRAAFALALRARLDTRRPVRSRARAPLRGAIGARRGVAGTGRRRALQQGLRMARCPTGVRRRACARSRRRGPRRWRAASRSARGRRPGCLLTTQWWSPQAATCARWVTDSTCADWPSCFINAPTTSPTVPPMPASISSKINVTGRATRHRAIGSAPRARDVVTAMASARRDSSPPEATLASARGVAAGVAGDLELDVLQAEALRLVLRRPAPTSKRPPAMPRPCIACVTASASELCGAAARSALNALGFVRGSRARPAPCACSSADTSAAASSACNSSLHCASNAGSSAGGRRSRRASPCQADRRASSSASRAASARSWPR